MRGGNTNSNNTTQAMITLCNKDFGAWDISTDSIKKKTN